MAIYALGDVEPIIHPSAYIHPDAVIIGSVEIGAGASVWPNAVIRGDDNVISIGERTSIQDCAVLHTTAEHTTTVGSECVIGHIVHLEGCEVQDHALVGSGSVVLHGAVVSEWSLVGANAVVPGGMIVPSRAMALGVPAKVRENTVEDIDIMDGVGKYIRRVDRYTAELRRLD